jgi:two-component system chemotaxis sensor kinase CheA
MSIDGNDELEDEIVQEFLVESYENLDQLDRDLVALEQSPSSRELLGSIFRTIHTIKGTSGFLAFGRLEKVAHAGENLLAKLRDGVFSMTPETTDALLRMVDQVRGLLTNIEHERSEGDVDVSGMVAELAAILEAKMAEAAAIKSGSPTATPAPASAVEPVDAVAPVEVATPVEVAAQAQAPTVQAKPAPAPRRSRAKAAKPAAAATIPTSAPAAGTPTAPPSVAVAAAAVPSPTKEPAMSAAETATVPAPADTAAKPKPPVPEIAQTSTVSDASIRVDVELLEQLVRMAGELVLARNQILQRASAVKDEELARACHRLNLVASELQEGVMRTRMQPIDHVWSKLPRVVRDLGSQLGRNVRLEMEGGDTELDRTLLEAVKDPLTHLVRNAIDHGIEKPEDRVAAGKSAAGTLKLRAAHEGGQVLVEVSDDGKGIDPAVIGPKAVEKGIITAGRLELMSPTEILQLVFIAGFSTAATVTNVSGRGVGMDVVRTNIERIGGSIDVESVPGKGTIWRLRIPLTLAIVPALTVECAGQRFAIPQVNLLELVSLDASRSATSVEHVGGAEVYRLRGSLLPLVRLEDALSLDRAAHPVGDVVVAVLDADGRRFGLVIDKVLDTEEIVVKPLSTTLKEIGSFAGATILGDGAVSLILDVQNIARKRLRAEGKGDTAANSQTADQAGTGTDRQLLVVALGDDRRLAVPLDVVTRLEEFPVSTIERVGRREVVRYRGAILPLIRLSDHLGTGYQHEGDSIPGVVYSAHGRSVALAVGQVIDIVTESAIVHSDVEDFGLVGSAVIRDRVTEMLDVRAAILAADPMFFDEYAGNEFDRPASSDTDDLLTGAI